MRALWIAGLIALCGVSPATALQAQPAPPAPLVTLDVKDLPLPDVLRRLFESARLQYTIGEDIEVPRVPISLKIREVSLDTALRIVFKLAAGRAPGFPDDVTFTQEEDRLVIRRAKSRTETLEVPIPAEMPKEPLERASGPLALKVSRIELRPGGRIFVSAEARWPNDVELRTDLPRDFLVPLVRLRSGKTVRLLGEVKGGVGADDRPFAPGATRHWSTTIEGAYDYDPRDPPAGLVWQIGWSRR